MIQSRLKAVELLESLIVVTLGLRVLYLFVRYILGSTGTQRFSVESWALIFIAIGLLVRAVRSRRLEQRQTKSVAASSWTWLTFCGLAVALYWPALSVGFLSDDFVLVTYASHWSFGPVTASLFRPLPLLLWALLLHIGAGPATLHLVNIVLHGTNAYLTTLVAQRWVLDRKWSILAGLLVLSAPLAPEAVVWCSGVFDLLATTLILTCILIARRYKGHEGHPSVATRIQFVTVGIGALASKETAAIAAALVLVDGWARNALSRKLVTDAGILVFIAGLFSLVRLISAFGLTTPPFSKYVLQRAVFGSFGTLAVPWHVDVTHRFPWLPIVGVIVVVYLLTLFFLDPGSKRRTKLAIAAAAWIMLPIIPIWSVFFIAPDLQQSRYLYLSAVGWAALIVVIASDARSYLRPVSYAAVVGLTVITACGTVLHQQPWKEAARLRDLVEASALDLQTSNCPTIILSNLPDSVRGAYVFRNGGAEAFARDLHLRAVLGDDTTGRCAFRWSDTRLSFVQSRTE